MRTSCLLDFICIVKIYGVGYHHQLVRHALATTDAFEDVRRLKRRFQHMCKFKSTSQSRTGIVHRDFVFYTPPPRRYFFNALTVQGVSLHEFLRHSCNDATVNLFKTGVKEATFPQIATYSYPETHITTLVVTTGGYMMKKEQHEQSLGPGIALDICKFPGL
jgi:hypothetical protein